MPVLLSLTLIAMLAAAQPAEPAPPVQVRPGTSPPGIRAVQLSETAEPIGLAIAGFDTDHDGRTGRAELDAALLRSFGPADRDSDGALGYIEYSGWATVWLGSATALPGPFAIDADGNDRISAEELVAEFGRNFVRLDRDSDGAISHAELLTVRNPRLPPLPYERLRRRPVERR